MKKNSIGSLTAKGWSQDKIARSLHLRKSKVVAYQRAHEIGKRSKWGAHVKSVMEMQELTYKKAVKVVKQTPYWTRKRIARMSKKEREAMQIKGILKIPEEQIEKMKKKGKFIEFEGDMFIDS